MSIKHRFDADGIEEKYCPKCKSWWYLDEFYKRQDRPDGLDSLCKVCHNELKVAWRKKRQKSNITRNKIVDPFAHLLFGYGEPEYPALWQQGSCAYDV